MMMISGTSHLLHSSEILTPFANISHDVHTTFQLSPLYVFIVFLFAACSYYVLSIVLFYLVSYFHVKIMFQAVLLSIRYRDTKTL